MSGSTVLSPSNYADIRRAGQGSASVFAVPENMLNMFGSEFGTRDLSRRVGLLLLIIFAPELDSRPVCFLSFLGKPCFLRLRDTNVCASTVSTMLPRCKVSGPHIYMYSLCTSGVAGGGARLDRRQASASGHGFKSEFAGILFGEGEAREIEDWAFRAAAANRTHI
jgi:hypothetical protein